MRKLSFFCLFIFLGVLLLTVPSRADVILEPLDVPAQIMKVTYTWIVNTPGETERVFPGDGFIFADGPITVDEVYEERTGRNLEYEIVTSNGKSAVRVIYPYAIPDRGDFSIRVAVTAFTDLISLDTDGAWEYIYSTSHDFTFIVPDGHYLVYCEPAAEIYESWGKVMVSIPYDDEELNVRIKTREMCDEFEEYIDI